MNTFISLLYKLFSSKKRGKEATSFKGNLINKVQNIKEIKEVPGAGEMP